MSILSRFRLPRIPRLGSFFILLAVFIVCLGSLLPGEAIQRLVYRYEPANLDELQYAPNAIPIKVGAYIQNYHDLSLQNRHFEAEGFYWFEWPQAFEDILNKDEIKPVDAFEIANRIEETNSVITPSSDKSEKLANGNYYFQVAFSGTFYIPKLDLRRSPFESITLPIIIETYDDSFSLDNKNIVLVLKNNNDSLIGSDSEIDGYKLVSAQAVPMVHSYGTTWGLDKGDLRYSAMEFQANMVSSPVPSLLIWVLPLAIVVGIVLLAPSLAGELGDIRLAIPSTGLLTLIFLQQTYRSELPELDYLTFLDWLYAFGYIVSICTFLLFVWATNIYQTAEDDLKPVAVQRINRIDLIFQLASLVIIAMGTYFAWHA